MKTLKKFILAIVCSILTTCSLLADTKPNIVFIFADDLGYGDLGCYGHPYSRTPAIDKLASEGTRFTQFYVTGVTCNPSRTGLMTGVHPARFPKYAADFGFEDRPTITELLKKTGYATGHFGKWHMGPKSIEVDGMYGIDTVRVIGKSQDPSAGRDDDLFGAAIEFIHDNANGPFYVNIWGHSTHFPVNTPQELASDFNDVEVDRNDFSKTMQHKFDECVQIGGDLDESMHQYLGDVRSIDANVGRVLVAIDNLGLRENTIVVFSSDHGPAPVIVSNKGARQYSNNMLGYAGEYRGGKHTQYEGGVRVPFIIRWPGRVPDGRVDSESVVSFIDWMPTLASITGIQELPGRLDGEDMSGVWLGNTKTRTKPLFWKVSSTSAAPSMRDGKWKLHLSTRRGQQIELYDISTDPSESDNVADENPDVLNRLQSNLRDWMAELPKSYEKSGGAKKQQQK